MYKYILKRLLIVIPVLLGVTFIVFTIMYFTPGDPVTLILGQDAPMEAKEQLREELGLNKPFIERYLSFVGNAFKGDFGYSYRTGSPVFREIFSRFPTTLKLAIYSIILATMIGVPIGILSAVKQYSYLDLISSVSAMFLAAIPGFWLGLMMILLFSLKLGWLPSNGIESFASYILPTISLALPTAAQVLRLTRSAMLETIRQDYIRTARAKGATEKIVIWKHALINALLPVVTIIGMHFGALLGGTVITESVYAIPGVGTLVINSIRTKDTPQVLAAVTLLSALFCFIMLSVDILYAYIDPRIKARYTK